jgi:hypothetical protein
MLSDTSPGQAEAQKNAAIHAKKMREIARIKTIQRTPYPMVLARIKLLLDKLHVRMRFLLFYASKCAWLLIQRSIERYGNSPT